MFEKLNNWIVLKIKRYLDIDRLWMRLMILEGQYDKQIQINKDTYENAINLEKNLDRCIGATSACSSKVENIDTYTKESIDRIHRTVESVVSIGTDVHIHDYTNSWAVVCIEGNVNMVKFVDLRRGEARDVLRFLKQFEVGKHCIDTPYKEMFNDNLFWRIEKSKG